jgi:hypothetical protein
VVHIITLLEIRLTLKGGFRCAKEARLEKEERQRSLVPGFTHLNYYYKVIPSYSQRLWSARTQEPLESSLGESVWVANTVVLIGQEF